MSIPIPKYKKLNRQRNVINNFVYGNKRMPSSKRVCLVCDRLTTFRYNRAIGHSECNECGNRHVKPPVKNANR